MHFSFVEILAAFMVLFAIIDILGSIPIILDIKNKAKLRNVFDYIGYHTPTNLIYVPEQEAEELNCITHVLQMDRGKAIQTRLLGKENTVHRDTHQVYSKRRNS